MNFRTGLLTIAGAISRPSHVALVARDMLGIRPPRRPDAVHLRETIEWLCRAQDAGKGGVSAGYHIPDGGWLPPYPETTGYIISTFVHYAGLVGDGLFLDRAVRLAQWEIDIQLPTGAVRGGIGVNDYADVFNTGQVIDGWCALFRKTGDVRFLEAAWRAGRWLASVQSEDGAWTRHSYQDRPHAYHARVAWPLLELARLADDKALRQTGQNNIAWILGHAAPNGWIDHMAFRADEPPLTHTIAYTLEGLLGSAPLLDAELEERTLGAVRAAADHLLLAYERRKRSPEKEPRPLPASFDATWRSPDTYSCVTGNAQMGIVWLRLYALDGDARYVNAALKIIDQVKSSQRLASGNLGIRGGVPGSSPCWGRYFPLAFPNWAAKFFADALMLQMATMERLERK